MKKKIASLLLAMALVLVYAIPVAAAETELPVTDPAPAEITEPSENNVHENKIKLKTSGEAVSSDPEIQKAYDEYLALETAYNNKDYSELESAWNTIESNTDSEDWTDAQDEEFTKIIEDNIGINEYYIVIFSSAGVVYTEELHQAFLANKNAATAFDFVDNYDMLKSDFEVDFFEFIPSAEADYNDAKANYLPSENVVTVYEAYSDLEVALEIASYDSDFIDSCDAFEAVLDQFNELNNEELNQLASLMGLANGEEAWNQVFSDWANACTILELGAVYDAYYEDPNKETAAALVSEYERVFLTEGFFTEDDYELFREFFGGIDEMYSEAKALLEEKAIPSNKPDNGSSPATGDDFNAVPYVITMLMAAAGAILAVKRRKA